MSSSKHHSQYKKIWFVKSNYPSKWLSKKSLEIIDNIIKKHE
jgi:hypothetical protein